METEWRVARARLRDLLAENKQASHRELAEQVGYSIGWVRKWRARLKHAEPGDEQVLLSQSHRPKRLAGRVSDQLEQQIIELRLSLSEAVQPHRRRAHHCRLLTA